MTTFIDIPIPRDRTAPFHWFAWMVWPAVMPVASDPNRRARQQWLDTALYQYHRRFELPLPPHLRRINAANLDGRGRPGIGNMNHALDLWRRRHAAVAVANMLLNPGTKFERSDGSRVGVPTTMTKMFELLRTDIPEWQNWSDDYFKRHVWRESRAALVMTWPLVRHLEANGSRLDIEAFLYAPTLVHVWMEHAGPFAEHLISALMGQGFKLPQLQLPVWAGADAEALASK
jgi:hypothetical protein